MWKVSLFMLYHALRLSFFVIPGLVVAFETKQERKEVEVLNEKYETLLKLCNMGKKWKFYFLNVEVA